MTLCFATWQKNRRKLRIANAGQSQPLLWQGGRCDKIKLEGFPLGIYDDVTYDEWSVTLDPGDVLVLYSDGLTEAVGSDGQFYGSGRICKAVSERAQNTAAEIADFILNDIEWFTKGAPLADDRALLVLKVK